MSVVDEHPCIRSFIQVLCGNLILKNAFISFANILIAQRDLEITEATLLLGRLNVMNSVLNVLVRSLEAKVNEVTANLNLLVGPFREFQNCPPINNFLNEFQTSRVSKWVKDTKKKIYNLNRLTNLSRLQTATIEWKQQRKQDLQDILNEISRVCP